MDLPNERHFSCRERLLFVTTVLGCVVVGAALAYIDILTECVRRRNP
jgi:hypothetical protein